MLIFSLFCETIVNKKWEILNLSRCGWVRSRLWKTGRHRRLAQDQTHQVRASRSFSSIINLIVLRYLRLLNISLRWLIKSMYLLNRVQSFSKRNLIEQFMDYFQVDGWRNRSGGVDPALVAGNEERDREPEEDGYKEQ